MFESINYYEDINRVNFEDNKTYLVFIAESSKEFYNSFSGNNKNIYGAIFPQLIFDEQNYEAGVVVSQISQRASMEIIQNISDELEDELEDKIENAKTIFTIVDGLSPSIQSFLEKLYEIVPTQTNIIGGGAGLLTLEQEPVVFSPNGIYQNSALILYSDKEISLGVKHGWEILSGPFISTNTEHNILKAIDYQDAFEIYKEIVEKDSGKVFDDTNFFDIAKEYPLGIQMSNGEVVVRDPIITQNGHLILVGEMDQNSTIFILKGKKENLISAAKSAIDEAIAEVNNDVKTTIVIDCISRVLYLEDEFNKEIKAIKSEVPSSTLFGALTLGEIANKGKQYIEFYNKTCVVGVE
jgi:hypothetical protein